MALINCPECGKGISDKADSCPNCGMPIEHNKTGQDEYLACPKCTARDLHAEQKGFSGGKALAGAIAVGGLGLLAGTIGSKSVNITCLKCGYKFKAGEALIVKVGNDEDQLEKDIASLLREGKIIPAVKLYKDETHEPNLAKAYEYVKNVAAKKNIELKNNGKGSGCATVVMLFIFVASAIAYIF